MILIESILLYQCSLEVPPYLLFSRVPSFPRKWESIFDRMSFIVIKEKNKNFKKEVSYPQV